MGNWKVGYNKGHYAPALSDKNGSVSEYENTAWGIEFAVNDALSVSYNEETSEATTSVAIVAGASSGVKTSVESEMESIIEKFNENNEEGTQIDTVDLSSKFSELYEYVEDYSDE